MQKTWVTHPFLFAILPIFIQLIDNIEDIHISFIMLPLILYISIATLFLFTINHFIKNLQISGLILSPVIIVFSFYGSLYEYFHSTFGRWFLIVFSLLNLALITGYMVFCYKLLRSSKSPKIVNITKYANTIAIVLVAFNIIQFPILMSSKSKNTFIVNNFHNTLKYKFKGLPPDIYYIILDEYASLDQAKTLYDYDNGDFAKRLISKGFYVCNKSESRYLLTGKSIAASINMEYINVDDNINGMESYSSSMANYTGIVRISSHSIMVRDNKVAQILKQLEYKYIHIGSWFYDTMYNKYADYNYNIYTLIDNNILFSLLLKQSIMRLVYSNRWIQRKSIIDIFNKLGEVPAIKGPKFVFAHIICPHSPFLFGPNGEALPSAASYDFSDKSIYLGQYIFITKKIKVVINKILSISDQPPIIIIQSDHGVRWDKNKGASHKIFNAYYLPNGGSNLLYETITPVNSFRVIFNYYFNGKYEIIRD